MLAVPSQLSGMLVSDCEFEYEHERWQAVYILCRKRTHNSFPFCSEIIFALILNKAAAYLLMAGISRLVDVTRSSSRNSLPSSHATDLPGK